MNIILFDPSYRDNLLPLAFTRPVAAFRVGILTIEEKWQKHLESKTSYLTQDYLKEKFLLNSASDNLLINGSVCPDHTLIEQIKSLKKEEALYSDDILIALYVAEAELSNIEGLERTKVQAKAKPVIIKSQPDIFSMNGEELKKDFGLITKDKTSQELPAGNILIGDPFWLFIEEGATVEASVINTKSGPVYIGVHSEVMESCAIRGPFALCNDSTLKMGAKIYGATTIGPHSKVGGEVNNAVIFGYSNKAHDGFLGNSIIGEWCNLGADTNNSNLKNNYAEVKLWNYAKERFVATGLQFCGLIMGDHAKCGINTMFNTGTVVGTASNVFGSGFPRNFIADFSWGGAQGVETYQLKKVFEVAELVMERRGLKLDETEKNILQHIFDATSKFRM